MKEGSTVSRRGQIAKRDVLPDPLYNSKLVTKLVNNVISNLSVRNMAWNMRKTWLLSQLLVKLPLKSQNKYQILNNL